MAIVRIIRQPAVHRVTTPVHVGITPTLRRSGRATTIPGLQRQTGIVPTRLRSAAHQVRSRGVIRLQPALNPRHTPTHRQTRITRPRREVILHRRETIRVRIPRPAAVTQLRHRIIPRLAAVTRHHQEATLPQPHQAGATPRLHPPLIIPETVAGLEEATERTDFSSTKACKSQFLKGSWLLRVHRPEIRRAISGSQLGQGIEDAHI